MTFHANQQDLERVKANAEALGVNLNWRGPYHGAWKATWPKRKWDLLELDRLQGYNGYTRRTNLLPDWTNETSFMEGIWDADGTARLGQRKQTGWAPLKELTISLTNEGLRDDLAELLKSHGLSPITMVRPAKPPGKASYRIYVKRADQDRFRRLYRLQPYKQAALDRM